VSCLPWLLAREPGAPNADGVALSVGADDGLVQVDYELTKGSDAVPAAPSPARLRPQVRPRRRPHPKQHPLLQPDAPPPPPRDVRPRCPPTRAATHRRRLRCRLQRPPRTAFLVP